MQSVRKLNLFNISGKLIVQVTAHRGEELFLLLASHGIESTVVRKPGKLLATLEMDEDVNLFAVQTVLEEWAQSNSPLVRGGQPAEFPCRASILSRYSKSLHGFNTTFLRYPRRAIFPLAIAGLPFELGGFASLSAARHRTSNERGHRPNAHVHWCSRCNFSSMSTGAALFRRSRFLRSSFEVCCSCLPEPVFVAACGAAASGRQGCVEQPPCHNDQSGQAFAEIRWWPMPIPFRTAWGSSWSFSVAVMLWIGCVTTVRSFMP